MGDAEIFKGPAVTTNGAPGSRPGKKKVRKVHKYMMQSTKRADILTLKTTSTGETYVKFSAF